MDATGDTFHALAGLKILVLDGGDTRCFSQLEIIGEFMRRVNEDRAQKQLEALRPCQYFDLLIGAGFGGIIAVLLGVLGQDDQTAKGSFANICATFTGQPDITSQQRSSRLEAITNSILQETRVTHDTKLLSKNPSVPHCKTAVCVVPVVNMGSYRLLRNYESSHSSYDPTLMETIKATSAMPTLFEPVQLGIEGQREEFISGTIRFNNPIWTAIEEAQNIFGHSRPVSCLLSLGSGVLPPISLNQTTDMGGIIQQIQMDSQMVAELASKRIRGLGVYFRFSVEHGLENETTDMGDVTSHTLAYLHTKEISDGLERCVATTSRPSRVTIGRIYGSQLANLSPVNGLPRLSAFFLRRDEPCSRLKKIMFPDGPRGQRIAIVSGMAGAGKTQTVVDFTTSHQDRYQHIFFVNASSVENLERSLLLCLHSIGEDYKFQTVQQALELLAKPDEYITKDYLVILDNIDDRNLNPIDYIPQCEHGSFIITTRDPGRGDLSPKNHLALDVMTLEEAANALLSVVFRHNAQPSDQDQEEANLIVKELGCLPLAVIQAGCYIHQQKCLHNYRNHLKRNRKDVMKKPAMNQLNKLNYDHGAYAAFETAFKAVSAASQQFLGILSFCDPSSFPRSLIEEAAKSGFTYESHVIADRPEFFDASVSLLVEIFGNNEAEAQTACNEILEELQAYSLVSLTLGSTETILVMHRLAHAWARDRLDEKEYTKFRMAATRLVASVNNFDGYLRPEHLIPHVRLLFVDEHRLSLNDRASFSYIMYHFFQWSLEKCFETRRKLYEEVIEIYGKKDVRACAARLILADAHFRNGEVSLAISLERSVVDQRQTVLGETAPETLKAIGNLARSLRDIGQLDEAQELEEGVLRHYMNSWGLRHIETAQAQEDLASTYQKQGKHSEAITLLLQSLETRKSLFRSDHFRIVDTIALLGLSYEAQGQERYAEQMREEALRLKIKSHGIQDGLGQLNAIRWLGAMYYDQQRYSSCEALFRQELEGRRRLQEDNHPDTLNAMHWLAHACFAQANYVGAQRVWKEMLERLRRLHGHLHSDILSVSHWLAQTYFQQAVYVEARTLWKEVLEGRRQLHGPLHSETLSAMSWLGRIRLAEHRYAEAKEIFQEALNGYNSAFGRLHLGTALMTEWLAVTHMQEGNYVEAVPLWKEVIEGRTRLMGPGHPQTLWAKERQKEAQLSLEQSRPYPDP